jgi:type II secretory pathway pseudopilin PulG
MLLELILALTLFSLAVLGLARSLQMSIQTASIINRDHDVRLALRGFLEEVRRKPLAEMTQSYLDPRLNLTLQSSLTPLQLRDRNGAVLNNLYTLRVATTYEVGTEQREEFLEVFVYKTRTENPTN